MQTPWNSDIVPFDIVGKSCYVVVCHRSALPFAEGAYERDAQCRRRSQPCARDSVVSEICIKSFVHLKALGDRLDELHLSTSLQMTKSLGSSRDILVFPGYGNHPISSRGNRAVSIILNRRRENHPALQSGIRRDICSSSRVADSERSPGPNLHHIISALPTFLSAVDDDRNRILQVSHVRLDTNPTAPSPLRRFEINLLVTNHPRGCDIDPQVLCGPQNETRLGLSTAASLSRQVRTVVDAINATTNTFELGL